MISLTLVPPLGSTAIHGKLTIFTATNPFIEMNEQQVLLTEELTQAGEAAPVTDLLLNLDRLRITSETKVPEEDFLLRFFGKPCFPRRDLSTVTGVEKCGKTFFTSMLMACCAEKHVLELERIREEPLKVLWYDTEQSRQSTKGILTERVAKLVEGDFPEDHFFVFNVRSCTYQERLDYLFTGIETYKPDMVIIDNVSDLLPSINDPEESQKVIDQLMQLSTVHECNITVVIHLNRTGEKRNLRGWLGTEILHKTFDSYYCEQIEDSDYFAVEQMMTRKYRVPEKLYYRITDDGLPEITAKPDVKQRGRDGKFMSTKPEAYQVRTEKIDSFNQDYIIRNPDNARRPWEWNLYRLFKDAMADRAMMGCEALQNEVMALSHIEQPKYYDKVFQLAVDQRVVKTTIAKNGRVAVILIPE